MATASSKITPSDRNLILIALDLQLKSLERAARAAKGSVIAEAYRKEADSYVALVARVRSQELEV